MTHEEAISQIQSALPHLDPAVADDQGIVHVRAMIQYVRNDKGELTRYWRYQQVDIGEEEWNPPNKPKKAEPEPEYKWRMWVGCSRRAGRVFSQLRPATYEQMSKYTPNDLLKMRGVGAKTVADINAFLRTKGYELVG